MKSYLTRINRKFSNSLFLPSTLILLLFYPWTLFLSNPETLSFPTISRLADAFVWYIVFSNICALQNSLTKNICLSFLTFLGFHVIWIAKVHFTGSVLVIGDFSLFLGLVKNGSWHLDTFQLIEIVALIILLAFALLLLLKQARPKMIFHFVSLVILWAIFFKYSDKTIRILKIRDGYHVKNAYQAGPLLNLLLTYGQNYQVGRSLQINCNKAKNRVIPNISNIKRRSVYIITLESLFDPSLETDSKISSDPFYPQFRENIISMGGNLLVGTRGGGSAATEFETLCGYPSSLLTNTSGAEFAYLINRPIQCLPRILSSLGYHSAAFYPTKTQYFNEESAYYNVGFQSVFLMKDLKPTEFDGPYLSDRALFSQMLEWRKSHNDHPVFMYAMTVASHYPHPLNSSARPKVISSSNEQLSRAANRIYYTTKEFIEFANQVHALDPESIIIGYGDHKPIYFINVSNDQDLEQVKKSLSVPIFQKGLQDSKLTIDVPYQIPLLVLKNLGLSKLISATQSEYLNSDGNHLRTVAFSNSYQLQGGNLFACDDLCSSKIELTRNVVAELLSCE